MDIYPCTVDDKAWEYEVSMKALFGHLCSKQIFAHDQDMNKVVEARKIISSKKRQTHLAHSKTSSDPARLTYTSTPESIETLNKFSSPVSKKLRTENSHGTMPVFSPSKALSMETGSSIATSGEKRVTAIKASFEVETSRDRGFPSTTPCDVFVRHVESPVKSKIDNLQQHEHDLLECGATSNEPIDISNEPTSPSSRSSEQVKSLDISLEEIADTDLREQTRQLVHKLGCSAIMAQTFAKIHCLQPLEDFFGQELEAAACRSKHGSKANLRSKRAPLAKIILLRDLFPTADEGRCEMALIQSKGRLRKARDLIAVWEESVLGLVARSAIDVDDINSASSIENETEDSQITLSDSAFVSQQQHAHDRGPQFRNDNITNRKEAYKAALERGGRSWSTYSPIKSSRAADTEDMELK